MIGAPRYALKMTTFPRLFGRALDIMSQKTAMLRIRGDAIRPLVLTERRLNDEPHETAGRVAETRHEYGRSG